MPEEINRIISDHLANYLFAPTQQAKDIIVKEGIAASKVSVTGNTVVDALDFALKASKNKGEVLSRYGLKENSYILLTLHRQENVDDRKVLIKILAGLEKIGKKHKLPIVFPIHPRTIKMFNIFGIKPHKYIHIIEPCGFLEFLQLQAGARLILSDSGGVQEEACVLHVPCVTLRTSTERPETVEVGANIIAGVDPRSIADSASIMLDAKRDWKNPLGDGKAAQKIIKILKKGK